MRFKFKQSPLREAKGRVVEICQAESLDLGDEVIEEVIILCKGDMRKIVNMLQSLKLSVNSGFKQQVEISRNRFFEIMGVMPLDVVKDIFGILCTKSYSAAREGKLTRV